MRSLYSNTFALSCIVIFGGDIGGVRVSRLDGVRIVLRRAESGIIRVRLNGISGFNLGKVR